MTEERSPDEERLRSELVAMTSHEMRRPLTAVLGFSQTLRERWQELSPDMREELLRRVEENAVTLEHMLDELLDYSRLELGRFQLELRALDAGVLLRGVVSNMERDLVNHVVEVEAPEGLQLLTEPYAFDRILGNLLTNAVRYSAVGGAIVIRATRAGDGWVELSVTDEGPGIPVLERERVFERFYRGNGAGRGAGLGLAVVHELVALHGGSVSVAEGPGGVGAAFTVRFPAA